MAKPEWGTKRICQSCAVKFYDFGRSPIVCPQCSAKFDPESLLKSRRTRPSATPKPPPEKTDAKPTNGEKKEAVPGQNNEAAADLSDADDEDAVIEDVSDLGRDDKDVAEIVVTRDDDKD